MHLQSRTERWWDCSSLSRRVEDMPRHRLKGAQRILARTIGPFRVPRLRIEAHGARKSALAVAKEPAPCGGPSDRGEAENQGAAAQAEAARCRGPESG